MRGCSTCRGREAPARIAELVGAVRPRAALDATAEALPLGHPPAPLARRRGDARARAADPRRADLRRRPGGARRFWELLIDLSRATGVTIFVSTHFMNEAARCDRISLMHAGACWRATRRRRWWRRAAPRAWRRPSSATSRKRRGEAAPAGSRQAGARRQPPGTRRRRRRRVQPPAPVRLRLPRGLELLRDPSGSASPCSGTVLLMFVFGYGITFDVENLTFAALDRDGTPESRDYIAAIRRLALLRRASADRRLRRARPAPAQRRAALAIEIPPGFGRDLERAAARPRSAAWIDGAMPFRAETVQRLRRRACTSASWRCSAQRAGRAAGGRPSPRSRSRFRYNQDFKSLYAMVPAMIPILLVLIPAMLTALGGGAREGARLDHQPLRHADHARWSSSSASNCPTSRWRCSTSCLLVAMAVLLFGVPLKGSLPALTAGRAALRHGDDRRSAC